MNDNELIAWEVIDNDFYTYYICLNKDTAEYLRDWLEADTMNMDKQWGHTCSTTYTVSECEVIVG